MTRNQLLLLACSWSALATGAPVSSPPCHHPAAFPEEKAEAIRRMLPAEITKWKAFLSECRRKWNTPEAFPPPAVGRIGKRLEMAERILAVFDSALKSGNPDELFFIPRRLRSLEQFETYFKKEEQLAAEIVAAPEPIVLSVRDFGAAGDGVADDFAAFHAAFAAAEKAGGRPVVIRVPAGTYFLGQIHRGREAKTGENEKFRAPLRSHLVMTQLRNVTLEGESPENTTLLFGVDEGTGLSLVDCEGVVIRNFTLRSRTTPFAEFEVLATDPASQTIRAGHLPGTLTPDSPLMGGKKRRVCLGFSGPGGTLVAGDFFYAGDYFPEADGTVRLRLVHGAVERLQKGMRFVIPARRDAAAVYLFRGGYNRVENVTIRNSWGMGFANLNTEANQLERCRILPDDGLSLSSNADGIHSPNCTIGPALFECEFRAMGDDPFNAYNKGRYLCRVSGKELLSEFSVQPGRSYPVLCSATGRILAECTVRETVPAEYEGRQVRKITTTEPLPSGVRTYESLDRNPFNAEEEMAIYLGESTSSRPDLLFDPLRGGAWSIISGCRFADNRNCGPVIQCDNTLLEDTSIRNMESHAVKIGGFTTWCEGPPPLNVLMRNCTVENSGRIRTEFFVGNNGSMAPVRMIRDVAFINNKVRNARSFAFSFDCVSGIVFENNRIANPRRGAVELLNCTTPVCRGNTLDGKPYTPESAAETLVWPIHFRLSDAPEKMVALQGKWQRGEGILQSDGGDFEAVYSTRYSALKHLKLSARFSFKQNRGTAGLRLIEHVGVPDNGYYFLIDGSADTFTVESRRRDGNGKWTAKQIFRETLSPASTRTIAVESTGTAVSVSVDGRRLWQGGAPLPVFYHSGFVAFNAPVRLEELDIAAGGPRGGILAFGDSLTHHCRWQDALAKREKLAITNGGMACDDTVSARRRLETDVIALQPQLVLILLGTNNGSAEQALEDLKSITRRLREEGIAVALCTVPPRTPLPERAVKLNALLRPFCREANLPLHDWYAALENGSGAFKPEYGPGVHPNAAGVEAMARSFASDPVMAQLLKNVTGTGTAQPESNTH